MTALNNAYISLSHKEKDAIKKRKLLDSSIHYNKLGFEKSKFYKKENFSNYFVVLRAVISYELKAYKASIGDLNTAYKKAVKIPQKESIPDIFST